MQQTADKYPAKERAVGIKLDPRSKLFLLLTITSLMLSTSSEGAMGLVKLVLGLIPFLLLLSERKFLTAGKYTLFYLVFFGIEHLVLMGGGGMISFLLLAMCSIMTRFAPGIMMGAFLISSTTVSEFIAAMERMRISEKIIIPLSVIFRFFPTIGEESRAIGDAMKMRGISLRGRSPLLFMEYRIVPLMISIVKIGDELSAAALTRGLGAPVKRTNVCRIGFHGADIIAMLFCVACFAVFFLQRQGII